MEDGVLVLLPEDTSKLTAQWAWTSEKVSSISYRIWMPEERKKIWQLHDEEVEFAKNLMKIEKCATKLIWKKVNIKFGIDKILLPHST